MVTILNGCETFFDYRWDWVRFKGTYGRLFGLLYRLNFLASNSKTEIECGELEKIADGLIDAIVSVNSEWVEHRIDDQRARGSRATKNQ
ncbi:hypothetical protein [Bradyrhizobium sp. CCBAU 53380]|uniref:hypothetical protein n=1 Tax=Bradyrhizobium sp. CCBAU 53380 TaxID=1325117 RepID=UPI002303CE13|nr:hypothetical protein [Bradyrhizobium sp. CCBAU 53380]